MKTTTFPLLVSLALQIHTPTLRAQTLGTAKVPRELRIATVLIETAETRTNTKYVPVGLSVPVENGKTVQLTPTNWVAAVQEPEVVFHGIGSGVLVSKWHLNFFATAKHVVAGNEDVVFRVPHKDGSPPQHKAHRDMKSVSNVGWIYCTNADLAMTMFLIGTNDDVSFVQVDSLAAPYESVEPGDDLVIAGFPTSVVEVDCAALRSGMISAKLPNNILLVDGATFPGNSGGPVFWKSTMGLDIFGNKVGEGRPPSLVGLVLSTPLFSEGAVSPVTGRTRIVFEQNTGLTHVVSTTKILEMLEYPEIQAVRARFEMANK